MKLRNQLEKLKTSFIGKSTTAFLLKVLSAVLAFSYNIVIAQMLGTEGAGKYFLAFVVLGMSRIINLMGLRNVVLRYIADAHEKKDLDTLFFVLRQAMLFVSVLGLFISILVFFLSDSIAYYLFKDKSLTIIIKIMIIAVTPNALNFICSEAFKALGMFKISLLLEGVVIWFLSLLLVPVLSYYYGVEGAVSGYVISIWCMCILGFIYLIKVLRDEEHLSFKERNVKNVKLTTTSMLTIGYSLFVVEMMAYLINNGDKFILKYFTSDTSLVGIYSISQRLAFLVSFILVAVNTIVAPKFSRLYHSGKLKELNKLATDSTKILFIIAFPILLFYLIFPNFLLSIFGSEFKEGSSILIILAFGQFVNVITGSVGYLLIMCGYERVMRNIIIFSAVLTVSLQITLVNFIDAEGVAIGTAVGLALQNLLAVYYVKRKVGISMVSFFNFRLNKE